MSGEERPLILLEHFSPRQDASLLEGSAMRACLEIRREVFVVGQGVPESLEWDGLDGEAEHFLATRASGGARDAIGTARLRWVEGFAKAERVAVLEPARTSGVGRALMRAIEERAHESGRTEIRLNAQVPVIPFYEKLGYRARGDVFEEAGIPHRAMSMPLPRPSLAAPPDQRGSSV